MQNKYILKIVSIICACLLFVAVFELPMKYYTFLRTVVFIGALLIIMLLKRKHFYWIILFILIALLFNPIYPIYLYKKISWVPLDIIIGILFLLVSFIKYPKKEVKKKEVKRQKKYERDRIY